MQLDTRIVAFLILAVYCVAWFAGSLPPVSKPAPAPVEGSEACVDTFDIEAIDQQLRAMEPPPELMEQIFNEALAASEAP
jgi:hypothetical protein